MNSSRSSVTTALYQLHEVGQRFGQHQVLQSINLTVNSGATCVLLGPSGCGKTTLLRLLAGLEAPTSGRIDFRQQTLPTSNEALRQYRQSLGYVIQEGGLFPHLNGWQNLALPAQYAGWSEDQTHARIEHLQQLMQLPAGLLQRHPGQISGGQRQRLALMRALMLDPEVLLMDEPLGALDPMIRYELQQELKALFQQLNKTVVLVTHDLPEAAWFAHHIVLLRDGHITQQGQLNEFVEQPADAFVEQFIQAQRGIALGDSA
ncbi:MAG: ATP-binding cassette domain-containing protein [Xanthomonadales bacterium]|nr:ATP-binding cassette domain-containing protein [Xanthomonadales bacterium]